MTPDVAAPTRARLPVIVYVNAGDPDLATTEALLRQLDRLGVAGVELCVPYANPYTDGDTIRRSHARALPQGVGLAAVLALVRRLAPGLSTPLYLMADWSHTVRPMGLECFVTEAAAAPIAGLLLHGLPPRLRPRCEALLTQAQLALVRTQYLQPPGGGQTAPTLDGPPAAFVYVVSQYGASGAGRGFSADRLAALRDARRSTDRPLFVGFGVNTADDVAAVLSTGADGVVVGSAFVAAIEPHLADRERVLDAAASFLNRLFDGVCEALT